MKGRQTMKAIGLIGGMTWEATEIYIVSSTARCSSA